MQATNEQAQIQELADATSALAGAFLEKDGYTILGQISDLVRQMILMTSLFVAPVKAAKEQIESDLGDKAADFFIGFDDLTAELLEITKAYAVLGALHEGRTGGVSAEDLDNVTKASLGYSELQTLLEDNIMPQIGALTGILADNGVDVDSLLNIEE